MAKIAVKNGSSFAPLGAGQADQSPLHSTVLAAGEGWLVEDILCTAGPRDRPFEEQHSQFAIGMVLSGTFQYRTAGHCRGAGELMTPGSILLGNADQHFQCGHEHAAGDHCLSFRYTPEHFDRIAAEAGAGNGDRCFRISRVPPVRALSSCVAHACALLAEQEAANLSWEELSMRLVAQVLTLSNGLPPATSSAPHSSLARVTRVVRMVDNDPSCEISLRKLAEEARLSPYHFLRTFEQVTGLTPHQYVRRTRLRAAATRLRTASTRVLDLALDCGFGDVSNFNRAFHREFGMSPRNFRRKA